MLTYVGGGKYIRGFPRQPEPEQLQHVAVFLPVINGGLFLLTVLNCLLAEDVVI